MIAQTISLLFGFWRLILVRTSAAGI